MARWALICLSICVLIGILCIGANAKRQDNTQLYYKQTTTYHESGSIDPVIKFSLIIVISVFVFCACIVGCIQCCCRHFSVKRDPLHNYQAHVYHSGEYQTALPPPPPSGPYYQQQKLPQYRQQNVKTTRF